MKLIDLTGRRFGRLIVTSKAGHKGVDRTWNCLCDCGTKVEVRGATLRAGKTLSCKCYNRQRTSETSKTHGASKTVEYRIWQNMIARCYCQTNKNFEHYGQRGITVCDAWRKSFPQFLSDVGRRPSKSHTLERVDNNGSYSPQNVQWATMTVQCRNKRSNRMLTLNGKTLCMADWPKECGLSFETIRSRIRRGWTPERALTVPFRSTGQFAKEQPLMS